MELSIFLAKMLGITYTIICFAFIVKHANYSSLYEKVTKNETFMVGAGMIGILTGSALVVSHNIWVWNWPVLITILGWAGLIKGTALILMPGEVAKPFAKWFKNPNFIIGGGLFWLAYGLVLAYFGFLG